MMVGKHGIQTFEVVVVVLLLLLLSFDVFVPTCAHPLLFLDEWFVHIYLNANSTSLDPFPKRKRLLNKYYVMNEDPNYATCGST